MHKKTLTVSIYTENFVGLLARVTSIFTKRHINIESISVSKSELDNIHRYTIVVYEAISTVKKIVKQLEKQIDIIGAFYHTNEASIYKEIALYKLKNEHLYNPLIKSIINNNEAIIVTIEKDFFVIEKTGSKQEIDVLYKELKTIGLMQFVRSGRITISKNRMEISKKLENNITL